MERVWLFERLAVCVAWIDFLDPELAGGPDVRERGVRIEIRPLGSASGGSVYASPTRVLDPAVCRIDLLESRPGAADRMHWHPAMRDGEPGDRTFDPEMPPDPVGWLTSFLRDRLEGFLAGTGLPDVGRAGDVAAIRDAAPEIGAVVEDGLAWARATPWPEVERDERGMPTHA